MISENRYYRRSKTSEAKFRLLWILRQYMQPNGPVFDTIGEPDILENTGVYRRVLRIGIAVAFWRPSGARQTWSRGYGWLVDLGFDKHFRVHHSENEFAHGERHMNGIESFWSYAIVNPINIGTI